MTDPIFARKLKDLFVYAKGFTMKDVALLKIGRHFRLNEDTKLILGRNEEENKRLQATHSSDDVLFKPIGFKGPQGLLFGVFNEQVVQITGNLMASYAKIDSFPVSIESYGDVTATHAVHKTDIDKEKLAI